jgi:phenylacetate-CoA ligase
MSTAFAECEHFIGGHHHPELIIAEVLDANDIPVADGTSGELAVTTLNIEGMPLVRFKTGDIVQLHSEPCACGRNTTRIGPVIGRKQQMIKYKGTTLYPPAMIDLLQSFSEIQSHVIEISTNSLGTDEILIKAAAANPTEELLTEIKDHFRAKLRVTPKIVFVSIQELNTIMFNPMSRKPVNFIDNRV